MFQRSVLVVATIVCLSLATYFTYFHRAPVDDILAANLALHGQDQDQDHELQSQIDDSADNDDSSIAVTSHRAWDRWIRDNKFISIGKIYDKCEGDDRISLGRVIMLPDHVTGGITSTTYMNVTLETDVTGGQMYLHCQYNGNDLLSSHVDLCNIEDSADDRILVCPIRGGRRKFVQHIKIPNFLPRGRYSLKMWLIDQNNRMICCGFADFTI